MRILEVNKFYYRRGGAESYLLDLQTKLESEGHSVAIFSMQHPKNLPSKWSKYFVSRLSFNEANWWDRLRYPWRIIYSFEAKRKFESLVRDFKPDIVHLHNIYHQLSPSLLSITKKYKLPVVMHLHDYKLISPDYKMFHDGKICTQCAAPNYFRCLSERCVNGSLLRSFGATIEMYIHHRLLKLYEKNINCYIAPSRFMKSICVKHGVEENKIKVLYNFIVPLIPSKFVESSSSYILYFGRLSFEKGISVLLQALTLVKGLHLKIVGEGPDQLRLEKLTKDLKLNERVEFCGRQDGSKLTATILNSQVVVIPSIWLENMPFTALETMALGKAVICSRVGGLPELVKNNETGLTFEVGDSQALANILQSLNKTQLEQLGQAGKEFVSQFDLETHYQKLLEIFNLYVI